MYMYTCTSKYSTIIGQYLTVVHVMYTYMYMYRGFVLNQSVRLVSNRRLRSCEAQHDIANCAPTKQRAVIVRVVSSRRIFDSGLNGCEIVSSVPLKDFVHRERLNFLRGRWFLRMECAPFPPANSLCSSMWRPRRVLLSTVMAFDAFSRKATASHCYSDARNRTNMVWSDMQPCSTNVWRPSEWAACCALST